MPAPADTDQDTDTDLDGANQAIDADPDAGDGSGAAGDDGDGADAGASSAPGGTSSAGADGGADAGAEQLVISLGEEEEGEQGTPKPGADPAPAWLQNLRKENRAKDRRIRELERQVQSVTPATPVVGAEPTLEGCDHDETRFKAEYTAWVQRKAKADAAAEDARREQDRQQQDWTRRLASVDVEEQRLRQPDAAEARESFETILSPLQQAIVLNGPDDPKTAAQLRIVLGRNTTTAQRLAAIADPVKFTLALADVMTKIKVSKKNAPPAPEPRVRAGTPGAGAGSAVDSQLTRLQAEADKSGDRTKVAAYLRKKRQAGAAA